MTRNRVLVVEDDPAIRQGLVDALTFAGHEVEAVGDGEAGLLAAGAHRPDLVLLDLMLPGMDGLAVLTALRRDHPGLPVIMVTARGAEDDRVRGLVRGADDYVVKPFSARELLARVDAVLRRAPEAPAEVESLRVPGGEVQIVRRRVKLDDGTSHSLTEREAGILTCLARHAGEPIGRDRLLREVWGLDPDGLQTRTVDMHVARLREKLGDDPTDARVVVTVRARGYMLGEDVEVRAGGGGTA